MDAALMDKKITLAPVKIRVWPRIDGLEMERLRLLALNPDHPHAVFLFTVERNKDKRR
jgi:hypothetical protein